MRKVIEQLVDDLTGEPIEDGAGRTVTFAVDGTSYELDLSNENVAGFEKALAPYLDAARPLDAAPARSAAPRRSAAKPAQWSAGYAAVREWAQSKGIEVSDRGRVANSVMKAYEEAHS